MIDIDELLDLLERSGVPWPDGMSYEELASSISEGVSKHYGPGPHPSGSEQDVHGSRSHGLSAEQRLQALTEGGFTVEVPTGQSPKTGWAVAVPGAEESRPRGDRGEMMQWVRSYRARHDADLRRPNTHWGGWYDEETNLYYLDLSIVVEGREEAMSLGRLYQQKAIYNLGTGETVKL